MEARRESLPTVTLALVISLGERRELFPLYDRDLLVDAAAVALRDLTEDAHHETDPTAANVKTAEAVALARVLRRLIPELRELLERPSPAAAAEMIQ